MRKISCWSDSTNSTRVTSSSDYIFARISWWYGLLFWASWSMTTMADDDGPGTAKPITHKVHKRNIKSAVDQRWPLLSWSWLIMVILDTQSRLLLFPGSFFDQNEHLETWYAKCSQESIVGNSKQTVIYSFVDECHHSVHHSVHVRGTFFLVFSTTHVEGETFLDLPCLSWVLLISE